MVSKIPLSIAIAVFNEESNISRCLDSVVGWAKEIVVVDGGSTDKTVEIAKKYTSHIIQTSNPPIFHINKQKALDGCHESWILQLDADEIVTEELKAEISLIVEDKKDKANGYFIPRQNYFAGHWLRKGGQYPDYVIRLVRRGKASFPQKSVHEQITVDGEVGYIENPLIHYSYHSVAEYWKKSNTYTSLTAQEFKEQKIPKNIFSYIRFNFLRPVAIFILLYIRHKGFLDGAYGFLFALFSSLHYPIAYSKYLAMK